MNFYTQENPPKRGNAKKIWDAFGEISLPIRELHYNPNLWGKGAIDGWGTWAIAFDTDGYGIQECWCGIDRDRVYMQGMSAPYAVTFLDEMLTKYNSR